MKTNCSITLYNKYTDKTTLKTLYKKTVIKKDTPITGANWQGYNIQATISSAESSKGIVGMTSAINIFIPHNNNFSGKSYIDPKAWLLLADADRDKYFTFQELDYIVKGECNFEFDATTNPITNLPKLNDNVISVMSAINNDNGSDRMKHYMIGGK
jgi:hypothetical protein